MTAPNPEFETDCIRRILAGEKHLFHDLIRPCERGIFFLLNSLLRNEVEAEDVAQETVARACARWNRVQARRSSWSISSAAASPAPLLTTRLAPAWGTPASPSTSTGTEGPASFTC